MLPFAILGKSKPCMQVKLSWSRVELVKESTYARGYLIARRKYAFLDGISVDFLGDLCNFWAEQLTITQDYVIPGLSSPVGKNCPIFWMKHDQKNCAILEPSKLPDRITQFLEERLVSLQNYTFS